MSVKGLVEYYKECFKEDSADFNLRNLQRLNNDDFLLISGRDEIASGELHRLPISAKYGESFCNRIELYRRERVMLHCSLFIVGKLPAEDGNISVFSPLVVNDAKIEKDEFGYYFTINESQPSVNEELVSLLLPHLDSFPEIDLGRVYDPAYWSVVLENSVFDINHIESMKFPNLVGVKDVSKALRRKTSSILPISALAFVERALGSRGVLDELTSILAADSLSAPLQSFLDGRSNRQRNMLVKERLIPALLSDVQKQVLEIGATQTLGAITGPPGTGKSYTISAVAAEHFTRGESVLIVAGTDTALDVIGEKLTSDFALDNLFVRAGQQQLLKDFKQYLSEILAGYHNVSESNDLEKLEAQLEQIIKNIRQDERKIKQLCDCAIQLGQLTHRINAKKANLWDRLNFRFKASTIESLDQLWKIYDQFSKSVEDKERLSAQYIKSLKSKRLASLLSSNRDSVQSLNRAIRARTSAKQAELFSRIDHKTILHGFPVWLVSLNSLHKVLPLEKELFDLVIIDEATQCNIASALPALQRAKRVLVFGDQKQLKHFSFLARSKEQQIAKDLNLSSSNKLMSYRENSVLDMAISSANSSKQVAFLDEHFRSQPELIHFSNDTFYRNRLKVMQHRPCSTSGYIQLVRINGERNVQGYNELEAAAILKKIKEVIDNDMETGLANSIGVLSPYSKHTQYLSKLIEQQISLESIKRHNIKVATPYGFQGEERDVMLLSFCVDNRSLRAASYLNKEDVFNVAVTRARRYQYLFLSIDETKLPANNLLKKYLCSIQEFSTHHSTDDELDSFQKEVSDILISKQIECWCGYQMLGTTVDILARKNGVYVVIDLIGYPGKNADYFELNMYKIIKRAGINVVPLSYALWVDNPSLSINALEQSFSNNV